VESSSCVRILGRFVCRIEHANKPTISQHVRAEASPLINSLSPTSHTNFALWVASYPAQLGGVIMEPKKLWLPIGDSVKLKLQPQPAVDGHPIDTQAD